MTRQSEINLHRLLSDLLLLHIASDKSALAQHDLRRVRFYMLRHIYQNPGITISRLGELAFTDPASTSRMVYSLVKEGLVIRKSKESDRREKLIWLTDAGKELYEKADVDFSEDIHNRFTSINSEQLEQMLPHLLILKEALERNLQDQDGIQADD